MDSIYDKYATFQRAIEWGESPITVLLSEARPRRPERLHEPGSHRGLYRGLHLGRVAAAECCAAGRRNLGGKWEYSAIDLLRARVAIHLAKQDRARAGGQGSVLPAWPCLERVDAAVLVLWRSKERNGAGGSSGGGASL
jgi:hypothetical protein